MKTDGENFEYALLTVFRNLLRIAKTPVERGVNVPVSALVPNPGRCQPPAEFQPRARTRRSSVRASLRLRHR
jgi:hypothetical protein